jgi:hypothetical protein
MALQSVNNVIMVRATGAGTDETFTINRTGIAYDLVVVATNGGVGTVTLQNGAAAISGALDPANTDTRVVRSATGDPWVSAQKTLAVGDALTFNVSVATLSYEAYCYIYPTLGFAA